MQIKILTFQYANNYGAILQCYALARILRGFGHEVEILDVLPVKKNKSIKTQISQFILSRPFKTFKRKYLPPFTRSFSSFRELQLMAPPADCYIVGSDQVWNPQITQENLAIYFLDFLPEKTIRLSYAASFGLDKWPLPLRETEISTALAQFRSISVREKSAIQICRETFHTDAVQVLDPTLLLRDYDHLLPASKTRKKPFVVTYKFERDNSWYTFINQVSTELQTPLLCINDNKPKLKAVSSRITSIPDWIASI